jgi:cell division septation protein DedD
VIRPEGGYAFRLYHLTWQLKVFIEVGVFTLHRAIGMKKNKKVSLSKKPFLVLSRRAIAGWIGVIFLLCAWMFVVGVLVGRGTAPLGFKVDGIHSKLEITGRNLQDRPEGPAAGESDLARDKSKLDFYEALPEDREDTKIEEKKSGRVVSKKVEPAPAKKPLETTPKKSTKKSAPEKQSGKTAKPAKKESTKKKTKQTIAAKKPSAVSGKGYTVQVAAFKNEKDANNMVKKLNASGYDAYRTLTKIKGKGIWFRVRVGKYRSRAEARSTENKLKKSGMKPMIVKME